MEIMTNYSAVEDYSERSLRKMTFGGHIPVMPEEVILGLAIKSDGCYVDATLGCGNHSRMILDRLGENGRLIVIDQDPEAIALAQRLFRDDKRVLILHGSFTNLQNWAFEFQFCTQVSGILFDLGMSTRQLEVSGRGFSFQRDEVLDMRMDPSQGSPVHKWLNSATEQEISEILHEFGEERYAKRIAKAIIKARKENYLERTTQLVKAISNANFQVERRRNPATRTFQALRIFANDELGALTDGLKQAHNILIDKGRLLVLSYQSLEDRIVKRFIYFMASGGHNHRLSQVPVKGRLWTPELIRINRGQKATLAEVKGNPAARSAILRIAEKITITAGTE